MNVRQSKLYRLEYVPLCSIHEQNKLYRSVTNVYTMGKIFTKGTANITDWWHRNTVYIVNNNSTHKSLG